MEDGDHMGLVIQDQCLLDNLDRKEPVEVVQVAVMEVEMVVKVVLVLL